jgi:hypothetical protein
MAAMLSEIGAPKTPVPSILLSTNEDKWAPGPEGDKSHKADARPDSQEAPDCNKTLH